jgi:glycosyltransferase involved in cell wall biosynthesis
VKELVTDGKTGVLFEPGNPASLAEAVGRLLADLPAARQGAEIGRLRVVQEFSPAQVAQGYSELFHRILATASQP